MAGAAFDVVTSPVALVKDVATLGGTITGERKSYTEKQLRKIGDDLDEAVESILPE